MDARINTADNFSASDKNLVNVSPVTSEFCWMFAPNELYVRLCHTFLFNRIRQTAPIVDADARSLVSSGVTARQASSHWA